MTNPERIFLSPPHMSGTERQLVGEVFDMNYIAPAGPMIDRFERLFCEVTGFAHATAVTSGTAALHLLMRGLRVGAGDEVWVPTLTFIGGVSPVLYQNATPVFFDVAPDTWTLDVDLLAEEMARAARVGRLPKAVVTVDIYGQCADLDAIRSVCDPHGVPVIVDAAESMGAIYKGRHAGKGATAAAFSFNGNKIITTGGGGMAASDDAQLVAEARHLSQQAREPVAHYQHEVLGYNYRMSSLNAAVGCGQLGVLGERVAKRREIFARYERELASLPGISFMPEAPSGKSNRWLTVMLIDPEIAPVTPEQLRLSLEEKNIEARPVWKPMHQQPLLHDFRTVGGAVAERLFATGICLPSGTQLSDHEQTRVIEAIAKFWETA
ncbi:MAG: DegT/DnrJ/EryC1/StrS family aminotransferase [Parvibaculum sp.]|uniref:DegT/DnrJ/EryC1/StrS family aminotransferase n=1 Tax=Parvibaculum sp. TaxID=2024848 RepID=UPI003C75F89A